MTNDIDMMKEHENDYLWSGTGVADPEIARLERVLRPLRYDDAALVVRASSPAHEPARHLRNGRVRRALAAAAVLTVCTGAAWFVLHRTGAAPAAWTIAPSGVATIDRVPVSTPGALAPGRWLETGADATVEVAVADIGHLTVRPDSRLRITESRTGIEHRVQLARGTIEAFIYAPPRLFFVDTPSAVAVDLGCVYELQVDEAGDGELSVSVGWVMLENGDHAVTVPADARCAIHAGRGPGVPLFGDAPPAFAAAVARLDEDPSDEPALRAALDAARSRDRLSLWHLLPRVEAPDRARVLARMTAFAPLPANVRPESILAGDRGALDAWWDALGY